MIAYRPFLVGLSVLVVACAGLFLGGPSLVFRFLSVFDGVHALSLDDDVYPDVTGDFIVRVARRWHFDRAPVDAFGPGHRVALYGNSDRWYVLPSFTPDALRCSAGAVLCGIQLRRSDLALWNPWDGQWVMSGVVMLPISEIGSVLRLRMTPLNVVDILGTPFASTSAKVSMYDSSRGPSELRYEHPNGTIFARFTNDELVQVDLLPGGVGICEGVLLLGGPGEGGGASLHSSIEYQETSGRGNGSAAGSD